MFANDLLDDWKPQSRPVALGGLEQMKGVKSFRYTMAGITDLKYSVIVGSVSFYAEYASIGHGLNRILRFRITCFILATSSGTSGRFSSNSV